MSRHLLRLDEVMARTGLSRSDVYRGMADKTFPTHLLVGKRAVAWVADEVDAWIEARIAARGKKRNPPVPRQRARRQRVSLAAGAE